MKVIEAIIDIENIEKAIVALTSVNKDMFSSKEYYYPAEFTEIMSSEFQSKIIIKVIETGNNPDYWEKNVFELIKGLSTFTVNKIEVRTSIIEKRQFI